MKKLKDVLNDKEFRRFVGSVLSAGFGGVIVIAFFSGILSSTLQEEGIQIGFISLVSLILGFAAVALLIAFIAVGIRVSRRYPSGVVEVTKILRDQFDEEIDRLHLRQRRELEGS